MLLNLGCIRNNRCNWPRHMPVPQLLYILMHLISHRLIHSLHPSPLLCLRSMSVHRPLLDEFVVVSCTDIGHSFGPFSLPSEVATSSPQVKYSAPTGSNRTPLCIMLVRNNGRVGHIVPLEAKRIVEGLVAQSDPKDSPGETHPKTLEPKPALPAYSRACPASLPAWTLAQYDLNDLALRVSRTVPSPLLGISRGV